MIDDSAVLRHRGPNQSNLAVFYSATFALRNKRVPIGFFLLSVEFLSTLCFG